MDIKNLPTGDIKTRAMKLKSPESTGILSDSKIPEINFTQVVFTQKPVNTFNMITLIEEKGLCLFYQ